MKTKLLVERYGTWDVNRYSGKTIHTKTNPNAFGRDWSDAALRKEDELYGNQTNSTYKTPSKFQRYGSTTPKIKTETYALNIPFADKDLAKEEFKRLRIRLVWDKDVENPVTNKKGTWVATVDDKSMNLNFEMKNSTVSKWTEGKKLIK